MANLFLKVGESFMPKMTKMIYHDRSIRLRYKGEAS